MAKYTWGNIFLFSTWLGSLVGGVEATGSDADCSFPLGMENRDIQDEQITASDYYPGPDGMFPQEDARLNNANSWATLTNRPSDPWIQVDFVSTVTISGIRTQGGAHGWITMLQIQYGDKEDSLMSIAEGQEFTANNDSDTIVNILFENSITAMILRIVPTQWNTWIVLRFEVIGCQKVHKQPEVLLEKRLVWALAEIESKTFDANISNEDLVGDLEVFGAKILGNLYVDMFSNPNLSNDDDNSTIQWMNPAILSEMFLDILAGLSKHFPDGDSGPIDGRPNPDTDGWIEVNINGPGIGTIIVRIPASLAYDGFRWRYGNDESSPQISIAGKALENLPQGNKVITVVYTAFENYRMKGTVNVKDIFGLWQIASGIIGIRLAIDGTAYSIPVSYGLPIQTTSCGFLKQSASEDNKNKTLCSFWDTSSSIFSTAGLSMDAFGDHFVSCLSNHITSFAVLLQFNECPIPEAHARAMDVLSKVCIPISIISLFITICVFLVFESLRNSERYQIHVNLAVTLMVALCLFLPGIDLTNNKSECTAIAMILHFLLLSVFGWMLVEGISLFYKIVIVYGAEKNRMPLYIGIGYGIPAAIVTISSALRFNNYTSPGSCWLDVQSGLIWAFGAPAAVVILLNTMLMILIGRIIFRAANAVNEGFSDGTRATLRGTLVLTPLLGTTWIFGYFSFTGLVFQYLFVICNSLQGFFIFLAFCALNKEVQGHIKTAFERHYLARNRVVSFETTKTKDTGSNLN